MGMLKNSMRVVLVMAGLFACLAANAQAPLTTMTQVTLSDAVVTATWSQDPSQYIAIAVGQDQELLKSTGNRTVQSTLRMQVISLSTGKIPVSEIVAFVPALVLRFAMPDGQKLFVLSKDKGKSTWVFIDEVAKHVKDGDAYLKGFDFTVQQRPDGAHPYWEISVAKWPAGDPCFGW